MLSGSLVRVHEPGDGNPLNSALPAGTSYVGCVTVPTTGAGGFGGGAGITKPTDGNDTHPKWLVTVKINVPGVIPETVLLVPVPVVVIVPGYMVSVQAPSPGNSVIFTLPVARLHVGDVMLPAKGVADVSGWSLITKLADGGETHPDELLTENVYVPPGIFAAV